MIDSPVRLALAVAVVLANIVGAGVVLVLAVLVLPSGPLPDPARVRSLHLLTFAVYLSIALPARVLAEQPVRRVPPGVVVRSLQFWALGTAVPVVGLMLGAVAALVHGDVPAAELAVIVLSIGGTALTSASGRPRWPSAPGPAPSRGWTRAGSG